MTIAFAVACTVGMFGWFCAWLAQRSVVAARRELADAVAGETVAKDAATSAVARSVAAETLSSSMATQLRDLQVQLDAERKARQDLVHGLAQKGVPVGDAVVDSALDRLYPNGDQGGSGSGADAGGDSQRMSGKPADSSGPTGGR
jgi:hypothetical protein